MSEAENVPDILKHVNTVTEQSGPLSSNSDQMQIPKNLADVPKFAYELLTGVEQTLLEEEDTGTAEK